MRFGQLLPLVLLAVLCGQARAEVAPSSGIPPLPPTALGAESVGGSGAPKVITMSGVPVQPQGLDYTRVLAALAIVLGLIFLLRWVSRCFFPTAMGRARNRAVEVISRSPLSPKQQVMLLRVGQRLIVVGDSGSQLSPLCQITDPDEVAALVGQLREESVPVPKRAFGNLFGQSRHAFDVEEPAGRDAANELREPEEEQPPVATAREELSGLRERVRLLAEQFKGG